jgi:hypothetical protein
MSRKTKFSNNWKKAKTRLQRIHAHIGHARRDYLHKSSAAISQNHALVLVEDFEVRNMSKSAKGSAEEPGKQVLAKSGLNKSILDQGWFEFRRQQPPAWGEGPNEKEGGKSCLFEMHCIRSRGNLGVSLAAKVNPLPSRDVMKQIRRDTHKKAQGETACSSKPYRVGTWSRRGNVSRPTREAQVLMTSASPDSHDLNFSNRPVRTRMPGGVAGVQPCAAPYADQCKPNSNRDRIELQYNANTMTRLVVDCVPHRIPISSKNSPRTCMRIREP